MPTYLCHGFRWHRPSIRVYVIVQDIGDAAPDFISGTRSATAILESFYTLFDFLPPPPRMRDKEQQQQHQQKKNNKEQQQYKTPSTKLATTDSASSQSWSAIRLLEEYDPSRLGEASRPHAYVADHVVRVDLSASVVDEMVRYEATLKESGAMAGPHSDETGRRLRSAKDRRAGWLENLRDQLQRGEEIRWYVVVNGDEERIWDGDDDNDNGNNDDADGGGVVGSSGSVHVDGESRWLPRDGQDNSVEDEQRQRERFKLRQRLGGMYLEAKEDDEKNDDTHGHTAFDSSSQHNRGKSEDCLSPLPEISSTDATSKLNMAKKSSSGFRRLFGKGKKTN